MCNLRSKFYIYPAFSPLCSPMCRSVKGGSNVIMKLKMAILHGKQQFIKRGFNKINRPCCMSRLFLKCVFKTTGKHEAFAKKNKNKRLFLTSLAFVFWSNKMGPQHQCNACAFVFSNDILFYPYQQLKIPRFLGDLQGTVSVNFGAIECILKED